MTPGIHPYRSTQRTRYTHRPLEASEGLGHRPTGKDWQAHPSACYHRGLIRSNLLEGLAQLQGQPTESGVGHKQVGAPTHDQDRNAGRGHAGSHRLQLRSVDRSNKARCATSRPVGGHGANRMIHQDPPGQLHPHHGLVEPHYPFEIRSHGGAA